ncbi:MAG: metallopeptidase family protein [Ignavibacteria bacterium]|nr:metallopeptidase family protein [Ignavibacteria bacterium]
MTVKEIEQIAQEEFDRLPERFRENMENVSIVVDESPSRDQLRRAGVRDGGLLLGLYEGVPLTRRDTGYGVYPVVPDRITLFKGPIEAIARSRDDIRGKIREVLIHEIAHYYGMGEEEIRSAGY